MGSYYVTTSSYARFYIFLPLYISSHGHSNLNLLCCVFLCLGVLDFGTDNTMVL